MVGEQTSVVDVRCLGSTVLVLDGCEVTVSIGEWDFITGKIFERETYSDAAMT